MVWVVLINGTIKGPAYSEWSLANDRAADLAKRLGIPPSEVTIHGLTVVGKPVYPVPFEETDA